MKRSRWRIRAVVGCFATALLLGADAGVALATGPAYSGHTNYGPIDGWSYYNYSGVNNPGQIYGIVFAHTTSGEGNAPTGYMGAQAGLYDYNTGQLCSYSAWWYNEYAATSWNNTTPSGAACGGAYYYGKGNTAAYNGSGYDQIATANSPNLYGS